MEEYGIVEVALCGVDWSDGEYQPSTPPVVVGNYWLWDNGDRMQWDNGDYVLI